VVPWPPSKSPNLTALGTGQATAALAQAFVKLKPEVVLIVGDRVEAFAAASAAHISQIPIAHIHGGDRALGQIDDSLRHAITKLSHIHFAATKQSAHRIAQLGEDQFRIHRVGSPALDGIDGIAKVAVPFSKASVHLALIVLHPVSPHIQSEARLAQAILTVANEIFDAVVAIYPNNDPGSAGIIRVWESDSLLLSFPDLSRPHFLKILSNATVLIGNSSSGIIEAASFGTPVVNIGDRQKGRERNANVIDVPANAAAIRRALKRVWNNGRPIRFPRKNIYGSGRTSEKIARILASIPLDERLRRKLITY
jgi:GDP/UDP-N,N'-diacetylbacillosamine 2-epimerase (hydrolysing)